LAGEKAVLRSRRLVYRPIMMEFDKYQYQIIYVDFKSIETGKMNLELNIVDCKNFSSLL
jgi:hypothetical protein